MTTHVGPCRQSRCKVQEGDPSESPNISLRTPSFCHSQLYSSTDVLTHSHACFHSHIYSPLNPKDTQSLYQSVWAELCLSNKHPQILTQHGSRGFSHTYSILLTHIHTLPHPLTHTDTQTQRLYISQCGLGYAAATSSPQPQNCVALRTCLFPAQTLSPSWLGWGSAPTHLPSCLADDASSLFLWSQQRKRRQRTTHWCLELHSKITCGISHFIVQSTSPGREGCHGSVILLQGGAGKISD